MSGLENKNAPINCNYSSTSNRLIINAPPNYEQTHELRQCPLCDRPNPFLNMYIPVREWDYFDICLYTCDTVCECVYGADRDPINYDIKIKPHSHKFSVKHEYTDWIQITSKSTIEPIKKGSGEHEMEECYRRTMTLLASRSGPCKKNLAPYF